MVIELADEKYPYGRIEVLTGTHCASQFAVWPDATIGSKAAHILLVDPVVSPLHVRFDVDEHRQTTIVDQESNQGLFVYRIDKTGVGHKYKVASVKEKAFVLQAGDVLTLGDPDNVQDALYPVTVLFDHPYF